MKNLFANFWLTLGLMILVVLADFIALTSKAHIGLGFVIALVYFLSGIVLKSKE
jgi:hypothetical protein